MTPKASGVPFVTSEEDAPHSLLQGVDFAVLLPREKSECVEILLERFPKNLSFPLHQHKECEQTYLVVDGEAQVQLGEQMHTLKKGSVVYIPRNTDHSIRNTGDRDLVYLVVETYPDGYPPDEPTWQSHLLALKKHYGEDG